MDLVEAPCGFAVRFKEGVGIIRIAEDIDSRAVTGNKLVFPVIKFLLQPAVKCVKKIGKGIAGKLAALLVKGSLGRGIRGAAEIAVKFLLGTAQRPMGGIR